MSESKPETPRRVFLLLQNRLLRDALKRLLSRRPDLLIAGCGKPETCTSQTLVEAECEVLVLDFLETRWLPSNLRQERSDFSTPKVLLICMTDNSEQFLVAVRGGVTGYLLNEASATDIISAVRATAKGEAVCPPKLCALLFDSLSDTADDEPVARRPVLTPRQQQLVALVANGLTNKQIASQLCISEFTVKNHIHRIMKLFDAESRSEAVDIIQSRGYRLNIKSDLHETASTQPVSCASGTQYGCETSIASRIFFTVRLASRGNTSRRYVSSSRGMDFNCFD